LDAKAEQGGIRTRDLLDELVASLEPASFSRAHGGDSREIMRREGEQVAVDDVVESEQRSRQLHAAARPRARGQRRVQADEEQSAGLAQPFDSGSLRHTRKYGPLSDLTRVRAGVSPCARSREVGRMLET